MASGATVSGGGGDDVYLITSTLGLVLDNPTGEDPEQITIDDTSADSHNIVRFDNDVGVVDFLSPLVSSLDVLTSLKLNWQTAPSYTLKTCPARASSLAPTARSTPPSNFATAIGTALPPVPLRRL